MDPPSPSGSGSRDRITFSRAVLGAWVVGGAVSWNLASVGAAATAVADHYQIPLASVGLFVTTMFTGQLLMLIPSGRLVDRLGARNAGALALVLVMLGNGLLLLDGGLAAAMLLRAVVGVGTGMGFVAGTTAIRSAGGSSLDQGVYGGIALGGGGAGIAVVGSLTPQLGWAAPFATGLVVAGVGLMVLLSTPSPPRVTSTTSPSVMRVLTDRQLVPFAAMQASTFGLGIVVGNWVVPLLTHHGDARSAAWAGSLTLLASLVGRPVGGWLTARRSDWTRSIVASSMILGAMGMVLLIVARPVSVALTGSLLVGLCAGVPFGSIYNSATRHGPPGLVASAITTPALLLILVAAPLVGWTFQLPGEGRIGFLALAAMWAATAFVLPESWRRPQRTTSH